MAGSNNNDSDSMITEINITPMVDVMLVLLVIFMVAAPALYEGSIKVELPVAHSGVKTEKITLKFTIQKDNKILLDKKEISKSEVNGFIKKALEIDPQADALIAADRSLSHGAVVEFIDLLKVNKIHHVAIAVDGPDQR